MRGRPSHAPRPGSVRRGGVALRTIALVAALGAAGCGGDAGGPRVAAPSGSLDLTGCEVPTAAASCPAAIGWSTANAAAPRLVVGGASVSTDAAGRIVVDVPAGATAVALLDGERVLDEGVVRGTCASASSWDGALCAPFAERLDERASTPFAEDGQPVSLEVIVFRPFGPPPYPAVAFHHGSTGSGDDPALFTLTFVSETVARFFTERGFLIAFPQRRGRGRSGGRYDEGFTPDRSQYSCLEAPALAGFERALQDVDVAVDWLRARGDVDPTRMVSAGFSRGGILSVAHAGLRPERYTGVVNFVGGWLGEGCGDAAAVNRVGFETGAGFDRPTLWLYGENDSFYSLAFSRTGFDAFLAAGGQGAFRSYARAPGLNGHFVMNDPHLWGTDLDGYLDAASALVR